MLADYDVQAVALTVPANPSPVATYRPAVSVKNNGLYPAVATGTISAYKAGQLVFQSAVTSPSIAPGATANAVASGLWTPDEETTYTFFGYVSTPKDQDEPNNNLPPTPVVISGEAPEPPVTVPEHASQHQYGGADELSVEDLPGVLADPQTAAAHVASHQVGGSDQLSLDGLSGQAAEAQPADVHGNEAHAPDMASVTELNTHATGSLRHAEATNLANRDTSGDRTGLVTQDQLAAGTISPDPDQDPELFALRKDDFYGPSEPKRHAAAHEANGLDEVVPDLRSAVNAGGIITGPSGSQTMVALALDANWNNSRLRTALRSCGLLNSAASGGGTLTIALRAGVTPLASVAIPAATNKIVDIDIQGGVVQATAGNLRPFLVVHTFVAATASHLMYMPAVLSDTLYPAGTWYLNLVATFASANAASTFQWQFAHHQTIGQKT